MDRATTPDESGIDKLGDVTKEFRENPGFRVEAAKKLLPHLAEGMTPQQVTRLLGEPSSRERDGRLWRYTVFYSQMIDVYFDGGGKVERVFPPPPIAEAEAEKPKAGPGSE